MPARPSLDALISHLSHAAEGWRKYAANELYHLGSRAKKAVPALIQALNDPSAEVRGAAACTLGRIGEPAAAAIPRLSQLAEEPETQVAALSALCELSKSMHGLGPVGVRLVALMTEKVRQLPDDDEQYERELQPATYVRLLGGFGAEAVTPLVEILQTRSGESRQSAACAVGEIGPDAEAAVPALIAALSCGEHALTCYACRALGLIRSQPELVIPKLVQLFLPDNYDICTYAMGAVAEFGAAGALAVPALLPFLDASSLNCLHAVEAAGKIGPSAGTVLQALNTLRQASDRKLREAVDLAICQIVGTPPASPPIVAGTSTIDFARTRTAVVDMLVQGLAKFAAEHPQLEVSAVGLFGFGFGATCSLCLETPEHSAAVLVERPDAAQRDRSGVFNASLDEFQYFEYATDHFEWWPSLYEVGHGFRILLPNEKTVRRSTEKDGNNAIDLPMFKLLQEILRTTPCTGIRRAKPFRVGVQMANSDLLKFWLPKT